MQSLYIPMSREEFERQPFDPAWKQSYFEGHMLLTPRPVLVYATRSTSTTSTTAVGLSKLGSGQHHLILDLYLDAFEDSFEYCDWKPRHVRRDAHNIVRDLFDGAFGRPLVILGLEDADSLNAAAAVVLKDTGVPHLQFICVDPKSQRDGAGSRLLHASLAELHMMGYRTLTSCFMLGNIASRAWHWKNGFVEEPDLQIATLELQRLATQQRLKPDALNEQTIDSLKRDIREMEQSLAAGRPDQAYARDRFKIWN
ncbi:MAG: hypothetical protein CMO80_23445 [Verrucomicrobiales bacterium]|nr:hypothetical protein [Verrucomicrobiales bacterium]|tara:strand:- start:4343 stop:5107 length:765 start_codon:yes stop_codon:yes gene_type:complete